MAGVVTELLTLALAFAALLGFAAADAKISFVEGDAESLSAAVELSVRCSGVMHCVFRLGSHSHLHWSSKST